MKKRLLFTTSLLLMLSLFTPLFATEYGDSTILDYEGRANGKEIPSWTLFSALGNPNLSYNKTSSQPHEQLFLLKYSGSSLNFLSVMADSVDIGMEVCDLIENNILTIPSTENIPERSKDYLMDNIYNFLTPSLKIVDTKWVKFIEKGSGEIYYDLYVLVSNDNKQKFNQMIGMILSNLVIEMDTYLSIQRTLDTPIIYDLENL